MLYKCMLVEQRFHSEDLMHSDWRQTDQKHILKCKKESEKRGCCVSGLCKVCPKNNLFSKFPIWKAKIRSEMEFRDVKMADAGGAN